MQRPTHGPWLVKLLYQGVLTDAVVVRYGSGARAAGARAHNRLKVLGAGLVWSHVVPELLGAGGSLLELTGYIAHTVTAG